MPKVKQPAKPQALTIAEVAERLMVQDRTIRNWLTDKAMPSVKDGRGRRFMWAEVLPWYVKMRADEDGNARKRVLTWPASEPPAAQGEPAEDDPEVRKEYLFEAELRKTIAEADLKELDLAERRGQVVAIEDVSKTMQDTAKNLQTRILGWPTLMIGRVFGVRDRNLLFGVLTSSARDLCTGLASSETRAPDV